MKIRNQAQELPDEAARAGQFGTGNSAPQTFERQPLQAQELSYAIEPAVTERFGTDRSGFQCEMHSAADLEASDDINDAIDERFGAGKSDSQLSEMQAEYLATETSPIGSYASLSPKDDTELQDDFTSKSSIHPQCSPRPGVVVAEMKCSSGKDDLNEGREDVVGLNVFDEVAPVVDDAPEINPHLHQGPNKKRKTCEYDSPDLAESEHTHRDLGRNGASLISGEPLLGHGVRSPDHSTDFLPVGGDQPAAENALHLSRNPVSVTVSQANASCGVFDDADDGYPATETSISQRKHVRADSGVGGDSAIPGISSTSRAASLVPSSLGQQASQNFASGPAFPSNNDESNQRGRLSLGSNAGFGSLSKSFGAPVAQSMTESQVIIDPYDDEETSDEGIGMNGSSGFGQVATSPVSRTLLHIAPRGENIAEKDVDLAPKPENEKLGKSEKTKKKVVPVPGVTISSKDFKFAKETLSGVTDLSIILPEKDCRFLGENFWIFTVQQLEYVLDLGDTTDLAPTAAAPEDIRRELLQTMATSSASGVETDCPNSSVRSSPDPASCLHKTNQDTGASNGKEDTPADSELKLLDRFDDKESASSSLVPQDFPPSATIPRRVTDDNSCNADSMETDTSLRIKVDTLRLAERAINDTTDLVSSETSDAVAESSSFVYASEDTPIADEVRQTSLSLPIPRHVTEKSFENNMVAVSSSRENADVVPSTEYVENAGTGPTASSEGNKVVPILANKGEKDAMHGKMAIPVIHSNDIVGSFVNEVEREGLDQVCADRGQGPFLSSKDSSGPETESFPKESVALGAGRANTCHTSDMPKTLQGNENVQLTAGTRNSGTLDTSSETTIAPSGQSLLEGEARLKTWACAVRKWQEERKQKEGEEIAEASQFHIKNQFSLQGPVSCLIPILFRNFLASVSVKTAFRFLSSKKTEASGVVHAFQLWRAKCDLPFMKASTLARYLLGLTNRLKLAITSVPPADSFTRKWLGCELMVLTGSGKEYIIDFCRFDSGDDFVNTRTKEISDKMVGWREQRGLSVLKGSGKVAMVSAWKTAVKETKEAEVGEGRVLAQDDFLQGDVPMPAGKPTKSKRQVDPHEKELEGIKKSPEFLSGLLKPDVVSFLDSQGIETAEELLNYPKTLSSDVDAALLEFRNQHVPENDFSHTHLWSEWISIVENRLQDILHQKKKQRDRPKTSKKRKKKETTEGRSMPAPSRPPKQTSHRSMPAPSRLSKQTSHHSTHVVSTKANCGREDDSFQSLSKTSKRFLKSQGITSSQQFLDTKTTDLANAFVSWREKEKMPALKGQGSIASISGWKGIVRKAMAKINHTVVEKRTTAASKNRQKVEMKPRLEVKPMAHNDVLRGMPFREFAVKSRIGVTYDFELSIRHSKLASAAVGVYLTYKGSRNRVESLDVVTGKPNADTLGCETEVLSKGTSLGSSQTLLHVLLDVPSSDQRPEKDGISPSTAPLPFSSLAPGCGLVELGPYGVRPLPKCDRCDELKRKIKQFVTCEIFPPEIQENSHPITDVKAANDLTEVPGGTTCANVFSVETEYNVQDFLYIENPMEQGQTVELIYHAENENSYGDEVSMRKSGIGCDVRFRIVLENELACLSLVEVHRLYTFVTKTIGKPILADVSKLVHGIFGRKLKKFAGEEISGYSIRAKKNRILLVSRRRLHWVASAMIKKVRDFESIIQHWSTERRLNGMAEGLDSLLWDASVTNAFDMIAESCDELPSDVVRDEVGNEVLVDLIQNKKLRCPFDSAQWCPLSLRLLRQSLRIVSSYVLTADTGDSNLLTKQQGVVDELVLCVSDATESLLSPLRNLQDLTFSSDSFSTGIPLGAQELPDDAGRVNLGDDTFERGMQAYTDAMSLCDEPLGASIAVTGPASVASPNSLLATEAPREIEACSTKGVSMRSESDVLTNNAKLHVSWYLEYQVLPVMHAVASSSLISWTSMPLAFEPSTCIYNSDHLVSAINATLKKCDAESFELSGGDIGAGGFMDVVRLKALESPDPPKPVAFAPTSEQLFLGVIWSLLHRSYGWQLGAGDSPEDVVFYPPGHKIHECQNSGLNAVAKQKDRKRKAIIHKNKIETIGWGHLSKGMKTIFVNSVERWKEGKSSTARGLMAKDALDLFAKAMSNEITRPCDDSDLARVRKIADAVLDCVVELSPSLVGSSGTPGGVNAREQVTCEDLLRFLILVPDILKIPGIDSKQKDEATAVVHDLAHFLTSNSSTFFDDSILPPPEELAEENPHIPFISSRIRSIAERKSENGSKSDPVAAGFEMYDELIRPSDHSLLTDYTMTVINQMLAYRASEADVFRKGRRSLQVGTPGLLCRHCKGSSGEGAYFFSSLDSFATASTVVHSHIKRCPMCPQYIKDVTQVLKKTHAQQRKKLKFGSQAEFFSRVWARLMSLPTNTNSIPDPPSVQRQASVVDSSSGQEDTVESFGNHIGLISYLVDTPIWIERQDVKECLEQYYRCLEEGGRIYMTSAMPSHFNSEWLLSTMVPRQAHAKTHFLSSG